MTALMWITIIWFAAVATLTILLFVVWLIDRAPWTADDPYDVPDPGELRTLAEYRRQRGQRFTVIDGDRHRPG